MERVICLFIGYLFGLFQTGYIYGKLHGIDIRQHGSGNSGSTNVLRVMGVKSGAVVFLGDFSKTLIPCLLTRFWFQDQPEIMYLMILYTGFGVILGHNFPFYMNFKGGKGIAATAGLLVSLDLRVTLLCLAAFVILVAWTRYVSLGSIVVLILFFLSMVYMGMTGAYGVGEMYVTEFCLMAAVIMVMGIWRHRVNIGRLLKGTENKIGSKK